MAWPEAPEYTTALAHPDLCFSDSELLQGKPAVDAVEDLARGNGVAVVRGPEDDVLARFIRALDAYPADHVVRLTADCPLTDPAVVATAIEIHLYGKHDYTSNTLVRTFPDGLAGLRSVP